MQFDFATAGRILFGRGVARQIVPAAREYGLRALLVRGSNSARSAFIHEAIPCTAFEVADEPTVQLVQQGVQLFRRDSCDVVIGFGGGSVIDAAKAIAGLAGNPGEALDYLEVVGKGQPITEPSVPFIAVPTTAGTGSEVTRNAVLGSPEHGVKASLRSPLLLARLAIVDPELTVDLPPGITASTGLDALTQLIEPYVSARRNAMVDLYCVEGIRRVRKSLRQAYQNGSDIEARTDMSFASLLGGLSLANAGLGVVHGFAAPIGGMFHAPHGAVCAALLPGGMAVNIRALRQRDSDGVPLKRYAEIAAILTGNPDARPEDGVDWVQRLCEDLSISSLRVYGIDEAYVPQLVDKAMKASSTKGNAIVLTAEEMTEVLGAAL
jgi:alcohol dehydrogenase class IV